MFRSAVAALLPLAVGATTILLSFLAIRVVNQVNPMSIYALNLINGLGLGLAIDYSLFMVCRFREELARRAPIARRRWRATLRTAGRDGRVLGGHGGRARWPRCSSSASASCTRWASAACSAR